MTTVLLNLVKALVAAMATMLTPEQVRAIVDKAFDAIENKVAALSNKWDDTLVLPLLGALRAALNVPDNDAASEGGGN